jgi:outer membrane protein
MIGFLMSFTQRRVFLASIAAILVLAPYAAQAETETLEQAWGQAYQINPSLQSERAKLRATDETVSQAVSHWRPSIDATANIGTAYQNIPSQEVFGTHDYEHATRGFGGQLTQPLFRGFRTLSETKSAKKEVMAGRAHLESAEQKLFLDTATAYLDVIRDQAVVDANRDTEHVLEQRLNETRDRQKHRDLTLTDVHQSESRLARAHVERLQAENQLTADRASYTRLVGKAPETLTPPVLELDQKSDLDDVVSAQYAMESADAQIDLAKGSLLPEVNLVASTGRNWAQSSQFPGRIDSSQIVVQATMPLYRSGTDYSKVRAAEQTKTQNRMDLEEARHKAHEQATNAWQALQNGQAAIYADKDELDAATEALKGVKIEAKYGTRTTLDILNAEQELLDAKVDLARSQHDRDLAILQIKSAIGELTADNLKLQVDKYDPAQHYDDVRGQLIGFSRDDSKYKVPPVKEANSDSK